MNKDKKDPRCRNTEGQQTKEMNQMSDNILQLRTSEAQSPFDAIKQTRDDGSEFWSARDLMEVLAYVQWRKFEDALERATVAIDNLEMPGQDHIAQADKMVAIGSSANRLVADYHLTRYGAYMVAMNCDPRKPEVAKAQSYFAIKTRQSEMTRELTFEEKALEVMGELSARVDAQRVEMANQARILEEQKPAVARMKNYQTGERDTGRQKFARDICKALREQLAVDAKFNQVYEFLGRKLRLFIVGKRSDSGEATAWAEKNFYALTERDTSDITGHNYAQGKLTPRGYEYAWARIFAYAEEHGHIIVKGQDVA